MSSVYRALILCSSLKEAEEFTHHVTSKNYPSMHFVYPPGLSQERMTPEELLSDCKNLMKEEECDVIIVTEPGLELVQASLASGFDNLNSASVESIFLCVNRYFSYQNVMYGFCPSYVLVDLDGYDPRVSSSTISGLLDNMQCACEVVPAYSLKRYNPPVVQSAKQFNREVEDLSKVIKMNNEALESILRDSVSFTKYSGLLDMSCLFVETRQITSTVHLVEGCVVGEEFIPLFVSDLLFWQDRPLCLQALSMPSRLEDNNQYQIWATMREIAQRLIQHGFDNQLLRAKVCLNEDGGVKVLELNCCIDVGNNKIYKHVYTNGDLLTAALDVGLGRIPSRPKLLPHRHALRIYISAFPDELFPTGEMIDFKAAKTEGNIHLHSSEKTESTVDNHYGHLVATTTITERSYSACMRKALTIAKNILHDKSNSPWLEQDYNDFESCATESIIGTPRPISELSIVLPGIQISQRSTPNHSPEDMTESNALVKSPSVSPVFPRRASSSTLSPISRVARRNSSLSPRRLSPILSASHNGEKTRRRPSNRLSPLATNMSQTNQYPLHKFPTPRDLTPVPGRRQRSMSVQASVSPDFQLAKTVAYHNRRRKSIDFQMTSLERAHHMRRLSDAAFSSMKLPSLYQSDSSLDSHRESPNEK